MTIESTSQTPVLRVESYTKHFMLHEQQQCIPSTSAVSLSVYAGQLTALIGPTGAGKSSLLKSIYRTYLTSSGQLHYFTANNQQIDLAQADEHTILQLRRDEIGFVTQFLHFLPRQASEDVVAQPLIKKGGSIEEARRQARLMLSRMNVPERLWRLSPATFSGGEKQRINLARGLIAKPRLLLLDEPTASLDKATTNNVVDLIDELRQQGTAMLAIFHHAELVERLADQVIELIPPQSVASTLSEDMSA